MIEVLDCRQKPRALLSGGDFLGFERFNLLRAGFNGVGFRVTAGIGMGGFDHAEVIEEKRHAAGLAERAGLEYIADFRRRAVAAVGETFNDDRHLVRRETFIDDGFVIDLFGVESGAFFDGAFDGVPIDGSFLGFFDGGEEARIEVGVRPAEFGRDHDFADQFDGHLALFLRVDFASGLFPLCAHSLASVER